jgi:hypothetical protein
MQAHSGVVVGAALLAFAMTLASCVSPSVAPEHPDFTGVWSGFLTTQDDPYWTPADLACFPGCPVVLHEYLVAGLRDPANAAGKGTQLMAAAGAATMADRAARSTPEGLARIAATAVPGSTDLAAYCNPYGFVREALNALPLAIHEKGDHLVIQYEEFNLSRDIWMDGRKHPAHVASTPLGHSVGRYEGGQLVVDTVAIKADYFANAGTPNIWWGGFADGATAVERYSIRESPRRLVVELTITDPVTLTKPYVWTKTWLFTPDVKLLTDSCEETPGQL